MNADSISAEPTLDAQWMPFTANRAFKCAPRMLVGAEGMYYIADDGRRILDGTAGLWCVNAGHARSPIVRAIQDMAAQLDYAPGFQMGHPASFALAQRLGELLPDLDRVFFTNSGSEAVDTALKMALAYHRARGEPQRVRFVGRLRGYHGVGFGGMSVGGIEPNRKAFAAQLLPQVSHLAHTHAPEHNAFSRGQPLWGAHLADELDAIIEQHGAETIAAVVVEPVAGSTGVLVPPQGYLQRLRATCDRHGIVLIFDEVITAFGRLGSAFAADYFDVRPDLMTLAKGLTNGAVPMGAVCARRAVYDQVLDGTPQGIEFFHGYTYSGHPLACAAGLATLDVYRDDDLFNRAALLAPLWEERLHAMRGQRHVIDVRNIGLVGAIELQPRPDAPGARAFDAFLQCFQRGVLIRVTGDVIALSPPLIIDAAQIDVLLQTLSDVLENLQ